METLIRGGINKIEGTLRSCGAHMQEALAKSLGSITVDREVVTRNSPMVANQCSYCSIQGVIA
ncbi:hypothetical protein BDU57DRAFT_235655 [Ampelomyces quisqualis]|uniref:Uncharacterized protein n=1 Tax=Ampelomyces quisqualis TaxID=50730 RepID=A0A6A5QLS1_AMPQU|nr:hypothetical protein BDU57DRAFT_235655 [Ampelomyces quisqualis]